MISAFRTGTRSLLSFGGKHSVRRFVQVRPSSSIASILQSVQDGKLTPAEAEKMLSSETSVMNKSPQVSPDDALESFANLDHSRAKRTGFPEAIFAQGKTPHQIAAILDDMAKNVNESIESGEVACNLASNAILATRVDPDLYEAISKIELKNGTIYYHEMARIVSMKASTVNSLASEVNVDQDRRKIVVACAGTTDLPVAEEAAVTLEAAGCEVVRVYDAGVAGLHRIIGALPRLRDPDVDCVIVCAGMDGALPSVVAGLVSVPVVAAPTSVGYGAAFGGVSALLTMLNSCAPGVGVVNIDNGFGAAALAFKCTRP
mmetsp:Transcript_16782/g.26046  ORF Transcript_16782/g.26046 Transcript_16782/m.26046 type:complete len:317 (+) Transcript_16782:37-987(+)